MPAGKVTLAARADAYQNSGDGSVGQKFRDEIEMRSAKLSEPPPPKDVRPLAVPQRVGVRAVRCERRLFHTSRGAVSRCRPSRAASGAAGGGCAR